jgi:hypothetical protein
MAGSGDPATASLPHRGPGGPDHGSPAARDCSGSGVDGGGSCSGVHGGGSCSGVADGSSPGVADRVRAPEVAAGRSSSGGGRWFIFRGRRRGCVLPRSKPGFIFRGRPLVHLPGSTAGVRAPGSPRASSSPGSRQAFILCTATDPYSGRAGRKEAICSSAASRRGQQMNGWAASATSAHRSGA